jgi:hypothetical protein
MDLDLDVNSLIFNKSGFFLNILKNNPQLSSLIWLRLSRGGTRFID